jgi:hypothetical protein
VQLWATLRQDAQHLQLAPDIILYGAVMNGCNLLQTAWQHRVKTPIGLGSKVRRATNGRWPWQSLSKLNWRVSLPAWLRPVWCEPQIEFLQKWAIQRAMFHHVFIHFLPFLGKSMGT